MRRRLEKLSERVWTVSGMLGKTQRPQGGVVLVVSAPPMHHNPLI
jgi:hypothetical protein